MKSVLLSCYLRFSLLWCWQCFVLDVRAVSMGRGWSERDAQLFPISWQDRVSPALFSTPTTWHRRRKFWEQFSKTPSSCLYSVLTLFKCIFLPLALLHHLYDTQQPLLGAAQPSVIHPLVASAWAASQAPCGGGTWTVAWSWYGFTLPVPHWKTPCALNYS